MKFLLKIFVLILFICSNFSCKKNKITDDPSAIVHFSQDSVLFDTVFTTIGSATKNIRIVNNNDQKIKISDLRLRSGGSSGFKLNVDGAPGTSFSDLEIAGHDSMYIFIQVNVNPANQNSPLIISDNIDLTVNGNQQKVYLEAWGQDAYYHYPTNAIKFKDGTYLPYSTVSSVTTGITVNWVNDKPHVIYGYLVVDSAQKLIIGAGTRIYLNYKAGLWVYQKGEIQVLGQKGNEVTFQGARREEDWKDEPGQWDRIWINEGSANNVIDYAIIKNGFIGVQAENLGSSAGIDPNAVRRLKITNTRIHNMSLWGLCGINYNIYGANNVIGNCQENSVNLAIGGKYTFIHCTFASFWDKETAREKPVLYVNNYSGNTVFPMDSAYFGNCIVDGTLDGGNEITLDIKDDATFPPGHIFSNCWLRTNINTSNPLKFINVRTGGNIQYENPTGNDYHIKADDMQAKGFNHPKANADASLYTFDLDNQMRNFTGSVTAGAYRGF